MAFSSGYESRAVEASHDFRVLMNALSRPGTRQPVPHNTEKVEGLNAGSVVAALTLCDHETTVFLEESDANDKVHDFLTFRCGCTIITDVADADFLFFASFPPPSVLDTLKTGSSQYPDRSATAIIQVDTIEQTGSLNFQGPGILDRHLLGISAIGSDFIDWWAGNNQRFPLGIDAFLTTDDAIVGLPRTVKIGEC